METASRCSPNDHLIIIGNGMACHRLVEALVQHSQRPRQITVLGDEPSPAYNRILLSALLAGELSSEALTLRDAAWYVNNDVTLRLNDCVNRIDRQRRLVITQGGQTFSYDRLVIATGSRPTLPSTPGITLKGVHTFRDLRDADALEAIAQQGGHTIVVGGGLLGLEAAEGLRKRGGHALSVCVLQRSSRLMNRQLDPTAAKLLETALSERGIAIETGASLAALEDNGHGQVQTVTLSDGRKLPADSVIVAAGITPNAELGQTSGLVCDRAIVVDGHMATSDARVYALGECCQFQQHTYGLVEPIWRQVEVLAAVLCGETPAAYQEAPTATKLKVSGISLFAFGPTEAKTEHEALHYHDPESGDYCRLLLHQGRLVGAVLYGDTRHGPWYFEQTLAATDLTACRHRLLFGATDAQTALDTHASSLSLTREAA
ncbi:FAD-dependent oxidoreductase [Halomonas sp. DWK9]|uniref:NAD(P)/FAD-dependent oxidoreductase n=1 Tax=Halomonas sp. DWK9 TaxID=3060155 RepID=UPI00287F670C|nr:FAD-dependent oxidoreductase [Halomonas sp. DWK9]